MVDLNSCLKLKLFVNLDPLFLFIGKNSYPYPFPLLIN